VDREHAEEAKIVTTLAWDIGNAAWIMDETPLTRFYELLADMKTQARCLRALAVAMARRGADELEVAAAVSSLSKGAVQ
jgi:hypothetical protein